MTTITDLTNTSSWPDEDLIALYWACLAEQERRRRLIDLPAQVEQMTRQYLDARDGTHPTEQAATLADVAAWPVWVQPTGAHDSYPAGWIVKHGGVLYQSLIAANVWEPGGEGVPAGLWETVTDAGDPPPTTDAPEWAAGTAYTVGGTVTYGGQVYRCVQAHTAGVGWEPSRVPALWTLTP